MGKRGMPLNGGGGNTSLTVRVFPWRLSTKPCGWARRACRCGSGGWPWLAWVDPPCTLLVHMPQLVVILASLANVGSMDRRLNANRTGKVRGISRVVVAAGGGGYEGRPFPLPPAACARLSPYLPLLPQLLGLDLPAPYCCAIPHQPPAPRPPPWHCCCCCCRGCCRCCW